MSEEQVFLAALDLPDAVARAAYLDEACQGNAKLRQEAEKLLDAHFKSGEFLDVPAAAQIQTESNSGDTVTIQGLGLAAKNAFAAMNDNDDSCDLEFLSPTTRADSLGRIGHYEVLQVLGKGGFGIVLRGFDDILQRVVAIKVMSPQLAATSPARKRFLREARSSAAVRHENVVQVYEVGEEPLPYLVMEFIPGETLQQRLDRLGPLDAPETVRIGRQIAEGLDAAHAMDLIHRDIKPGNVLLEGGHLKVKITDFGVARAADDASMTQSGMIAGTPMYMAPEQALGHTLDHRVDLFSLGTVMYQTVAGRQPFRANTSIAVLKRVVEDTPRNIREIIPETPQWLCDIITKLHAKQPDERYQSAREVADLLADCEERLKSNSILHGFSRIPQAKIAASPAGQPRWTAPARWAVAAAVLLLLGGITITEGTGVTDFGGTVIRLLSPEGTLIVEIDDPAIKVRIDETDIVITGAGAQEIRVKPGNHTVVGSKDGQVVSRELVTVSNHGRQVVRVSRESPPAAGQTPELAADGRLKPLAADVLKDAVLKDAVLVMNFEQDTFYQKDGQTYVRNLSGRGNDGVCEGVKFTPAGKVGGGLACQEGSLRIPKSLIHGQANYTITGWCQYDAADPAARLYMTYAPTETEQRDVIFTTYPAPDGSFLVGAWNKDSAPDQWNLARTEVEAVPRQGFYFFAVTLSDGELAKGTLRVTIDGASFTLDSQMVHWAERPQVCDLIGKSMAGGVIDEVTVFQRALTNEEIAAVRALGLRPMSRSGRHVPPTATGPPNRWPASKAT